MIFYLYLFIPLVCRFAESSSIKGRNHKNDLVPFLSSRLDTQKDNSLKIVSNEPFIIQFQMPPQEHVHDGAKPKDKKKKRSDKKRVSKIKPLRKKIRSRRDVSEVESEKERPHQSKKRQTEIRSSQNKTENLLSRQEMLKALHTHSKKKQGVEGMKYVKDVEKHNATSSRNHHRNHPPSLPDREPHVKMIYPNTPKSNSNNYSYKDLIADRERLEQKINYIRNLMSVNDTTEDAVRVRRKSDSDKTANKIAKMFLTLSAVNGLHDKKSKCGDDVDYSDIWEKERKKSPSRQSSSSNEERYKVKKWIEYMKSKRSSGKTCPCLANEYNEENDVFPLEQKLAKGYQMSDFGGSSEETSDSYRDPQSYTRGRPNKSGLNRNSYKDDTKSKLRALANRGRRKYDLPLDDLEVYRSRAKQILQNAEEILDKIKEEEEKRLAAPQAMASRLRELTSRIQGDPRNNENDLIKIIQKNLGWSPQSKSSGDGSSFVENVKSFILDPYEKAKALTDESTRKLSSYLLRNLGKIDSSEEEEEGKSDQRPQVYHGQVPQTEGMFSANLARENLESDSLAKEREEHQNWSDTLSAILGGNGEEPGKENTEVELKQIKDQEDSIKRRMEDMIKEQEKQISEYTERPEKYEDAEDGVTTIDLMTGEQKETPKDNKETDDFERVAGMFESGKHDENIESDSEAVTQDGVVEKESEMVKTTPETGSDANASKHQQPSKEKTIPEEFAESTREKVDAGNKDDKVGDGQSLSKQDVKDAVDDLPKEETIAKKLDEKDLENEKVEKKDIENAKSSENQEENVKDVVAEVEKMKSEEEGQIVEGPREEQDTREQSKQDRKENDVLNSKHLVLEDPERSDEELKKLSEDIQRLVKENVEERFEETSKQDKSEEGEEVVKKENDSSETKDTEETAREVSSSQDSVKLEKPTGIASDETKVEQSLESKQSSSGIVQASQDLKESLKDDSSRTDEEFSAKKNSEELVEKETPENVSETEKTQDLEKTVQNAKNSKEIEKIDAESSEKTKSVEEETEREDTFKSALGEEGKGNIEIEDEVRMTEKSDDENVNQEKEILRESLIDAKQDETDQAESLKATLDDSDHDRKSGEVALQKSLEEDDENFNASADESPLRSENPENEKSSGETIAKASEQSQEEKEETDGTESEEISVKASNPDNPDEAIEENLKATEIESDNRENEDEKIREEFTKDEEVDGKSEESTLKSENPEKDTERSDESLIDTSESHERVEAIKGERPKEESRENENDERFDETLKATADEADERAEGIPSAEDEKVEKQEQTSEESSREANSDDEEESKVSETPKLLMSIKEEMAEEKPTVKENQEERSEEESVQETFSVKEGKDADAESTNESEEVPLRAANPEKDMEESEEVENIEGKDDINVRAENMKDLDNQIDEENRNDEELRSMKAQSEDLNDEAILEEVNSLEQKTVKEGENSLERENTNEGDALEVDSLERAKQKGDTVEVSSLERKNDEVVEGVSQLKNSEPREEVTLGKKKNDPASEENQKSEPNQSRSTLKVPKSIGEIMRDLDGKEKGDYLSLTNLNPEKIDHIIDKIDEAEHQSQLENESVDCKKECACADEMTIRSKNIGRYEIAKDFLHWVKDLQINRVLSDG